MSMNIIYIYTRIYTHIRSLSIPLCHILALFLCGGQLFRVILDDWHCSETVSGWICRSSGWRLKLPQQKKEHVAWSYGVSKMFFLENCALKMVYHGLSVVWVPVVIFRFGRGNGPGWLPMLPCGARGFFCDPLRASRAQQQKRPFEAGCQSYMDSFGNFYFYTPICLGYRFSLSFILI